MTRNVRKYTAASLLLLCSWLHLLPNSAAAINETALSQTYEGVHLAEAARQGEAGNSKLEDLLHWAIENSDHDQLKQQAQATDDQQGSLTERQREVQQVIKAMQSAPSEADLMRDTIEVLTNSSAPEHEVLLALEALQVLVEPIDNANDLHTLHGLQPVIQHLGQQSDQVQAAAAYVLGTAASNNNKFQERLMGLYPDSIKLLLMVSNSSTGETSKKGLYALATLLRNNVDARRQFYQTNGIQQLTDMLNTPDQPQPVKLKVFNLITDLSDLDLQMQASKSERQNLLAAVHPHACDDSSSIAQDALQAVKNILQCSKLEAKGIAESSGAAAALQGFKQNLKSHISSICHVETHVVEDMKCRRDLLQMCNDIESMPCMSEQQTSESAGRTDLGHEEL